MTDKLDLGKLAIPLLLALAGCEGTNIETYDQQQHREDQERAHDWNAECHDESRLIATTAGSPNGFTCTNKLHKMHVTVSAKSGEEIGAVVFCECVRPEAEKKP